MAARFRIPVAVHHSDLFGNMEKLNDCLHRSLEGQPAFLMHCPCPQCPYWAGDPSHGPPSCKHQCGTAAVDNDDDSAAAAAAYSPRIGIQHGDDNVV